MRVLLTASILLAGISLTPCLAQSQGRKLQLTGKLKITLRNLNDSIIPPNKITVTGKHILRTCLSNIKGRCEFELSAGVYRVFAQRCFWDRFDFERFRVCWFRFERAPFRILPGSSLWINLLPEDPVVGYFHPGLQSPIGPAAVLGDPPKYASIPIVSSSKPVLNLLVQFDTRRQDKGFVEYGSMDSTPGKPNVIVSYDALTIYADSVKISKSPLRLKAEGQVMIEDGKQREHAREMELTFNDGAPVISVVH